MAFSITFIFAFTLSSSPFACTFGSTRRYSGKRRISSDNPEICFWGMSFSLLCGKVWLLGLHFAMPKPNHSIVSEEERIRYVDGTSCLTIWYDEKNDPSL